MSDLLEDVEKLNARISDLEQRVYRLEHPAEAGEQFVSFMERLPAAETGARHATMEEASSFFPVVGKAMLGLAGAYLLRAVAESGLVSRPLVAAVAIAYAIAWLVWAARAKAIAGFARAVYAGASALILAPMMWELSLRFHVLSPELVAAVVGGYVLVAMLLAWKPNHASILWVTQAAGAVVALSLLVATHAILPFVATLLGMTVLSEYAEAYRRGHGTRLLVAAVTDVAVWLLIFIYSGPQSARTDYPALSMTALLLPASLLFLIHASCVVFETAVRRRSITIFETVQSILAFLLMISGVLYFGPPGAQTVLGLVCFVLAAACYIVMFVLFRRAPEHRNFYIFAAWSAALLLAGTLWALPAPWMATGLALASFAAIVLGVRMECIALDFHGVLYLIGAAVASGLLNYTLHALAGTLPGKPHWSIVVVAVCAVLCYAAGKEREGESWQHQILHFVPVLLAACAVAALGALGVLRLIAMLLTPDVVHIAFARTLTVCTVAMILAFGGARWHRLEMTRIAYVAVIFEAAKLLYEDLWSGRMEFAAVSIFLFAVTLIGVPRLAHLGHKH